MERMSRFRAGLLLTLFAFVLMLFAGKLFNLQIIETDGNTDNTQIYTTLTTVRAARGDILDRNGNVLVSNRASYDLVFNHYVITSYSDTNGALYELVKKCQELGIEYTDHFPITRERPFEYTLTEMNSSWQGYFRSFMVDRELDSDITAPLLLEKLRSRVLIYCYQLSHICSGKSHIQKSLAVWKPELERYTGLVQQIKAKSKERKTLVAEKKELPIYHVKRHKALAVRIAELTEDLEELRFEKALLLQKFEYAEDAGAEAFRKDIATMEACLKKLETREQKYSVELDKALTEYAELKAQAADFDPVELYKARQVIRPAQEKAAEQQLEDAMHEKPSLIMLLSAKQETSHLLGADAEERQARQLIMHRNQEQYRNSLSKRKRNDPER